MTFVDEIILHAKAGNGGDGVVRWSKSRSNPKGGPAGGNGGRGGDVIIRGVRNAGLLEKYRGDTTFHAEDGESGSKNSLHGRNGEPIVIDLPVGSLVRLQAKEKVFELLTEGEEHVILKGGVGGFGNEHFKSSRNVTPMESTNGKPGEEDVLEVELRLIADVGLVGFPNAGKSSLLNALTNAKAKVGNYAFTTLDPNLGDYHGYIIADIPGIIEGASEGRGLGHKFLRHISRTKSLIFCISVEQDDPISAFRTLQSELFAFDEEFRNSRFMIALTKVDLGETEEEVTEKLKNLQKIAPEVIPVSIEQPDALRAFEKRLSAFLAGA